MFLYHLYRDQTGECGLANLKPKSPDTHLITMRQGFRRALLNHIETLEAAGFEQDLPRNEIKGTMCDHVLLYTNNLTKKSGYDGGTPKTGHTLYRNK